MKLCSKSVLFVTVLSSTVVAGEYLSPIENVEVFISDASTLSVQNLSTEQVEIDLYGELFSLAPASGLQYECSGYDSLELIIKNNEHEYFEVPCQSRIVINATFANQLQQGE